MIFGSSSSFQQYEVPHAETVDDAKCYDRYDVYATQ